MQYQRAAWSIGGVEGTTTLGSVHILGVMRVVVQQYQLQGTKGTDASGNI